VVQGGRPVLEDRVDQVDLLDLLRRLGLRGPQYPDHLCRLYLPSRRPARVAQGGGLQNIPRLPERHQSP
jgi:hypothetical protein